MLWRPENRALRALLWFVIIFVPGGLMLLAFLAAGAVQRRYRTPVLPNGELVDASLPAVGSTRS